MIRLTEPKKGAVLPQTLTEQIEGAAGQNDTDGWPAKLVELYTEPVTIAGKRRLTTSAGAV